MSLVRKVSLEYRLERARLRAERMQTANRIRVEQFQHALAIGMIKPPQPKLPLSARMVLPREELKARVPGAISLWTGRRAGSEKPYEVQTYARKPERNKYAGQFAPGTWL